MYVMSVSEGSQQGGHWTGVGAMSSPSGSMLWAYARDRMSMECPHPCTSSCGMVGTRGSKQNPYGNQKENLPSPVVSFQSSLLKKSGRERFTLCSRQGELLTGSSSIVTDQIMKALFGSEKQ